MKCKVSAQVILILLKENNEKQHWDRLDSVCVGEGEAGASVHLEAFIGSMTAQGEIPGNFSH